MILVNSGRGTLRTPGNSTVGLDDAMISSGVTKVPTCGIGTSIGLEVTTFNSGVRTS